MSLPKVIASRWPSQGNAEGSPYALKEHVDMPQPIARIFETPLRLLPWTSPEGKPCYLSTDSGDSRLSRLADEVEEAQCANAVEVLGGAKAVMADPKAGVRELRFTAVRLAESLRELLRVAESRGRHLPVPDEPAADDLEEDWYLGDAHEDSAPQL
jgi:hypothetical protein